MRRAHDYLGCVFDVARGGWSARCRCGFRSLPHFTKRSAQLDLLDHLFAVGVPLVEATR